MPVENDSTAPPSIGYIVLRNAVCPTDVATLLAVANDRKRVGNGARPEKDKNGRSYPGSPEPEIHRVDPEFGSNLKLL
jgi:hypothetical protein